MPPRALRRIWTWLLPSSGASRPSCSSWGMFANSGASLGRGLPPLSFRRRSCLAAWPGGHAVAPGQAAAGRCWFLPGRWSFWRTGATPNTFGRAGRGLRGSLRGTEGATPLLFQPTPPAKPGPTACTTSERKATHPTTRLRKLSSHPHRPLGLGAPRSPRWHPRSLCQMAPALLLLLGR